MCACQDAQDNAQAALALAAEHMKWYYDLNVQKVLFQVNDKVMIHTKNWQKSGCMPKPQQNGPLTIIEKLSEVTFRLDIPKTWTDFHPVFHASKLRPYVESCIIGQQREQPPTDLINGHKEYEVEHIIDQEKCGQTQYYLVQWKGTNPDQDSWEPEANLANAQNMICKFIAQKKPYNLQPCHIKVVNMIDLPDLGLTVNDDILIVELCRDQLPTQGSKDTAGLDLYTAHLTVIPPYSCALIPLSIKFLTPKSTYRHIAPCSGLALKGIDDSTGVVDHDYTGEVKALLINLTPVAFSVQVGDCIAQLILKDHHSPTVIPG